MPSSPSGYFRPSIARMQGYVPGEQPRERGFIKLNSNENSYPPSPLVLERLRAACNADLRLYPDPRALAVRRKLAERFGVSPEQTIVGNGSDELLGIVMRCFVDPGQKIAYPTPTYSYYQQLIEMQDGRTAAVEFPDDFSLPDALAAAGAQVTLVVNPNAPSGTLIPIARLEELAAEVRGILVVDEAYVDFADGGCIRLIDTHPNTIVVRTMSKSFSLAGMRIGFGFAAAELIAGMEKVKDHYNVNRLSLVAAEAALDDIETMRAQAARICRNRDALTARLRELGFFVWDSAANFVLARRATPPAAELYAELKKRRLLVRYFDQPRLKDCLRITVGTEAETALLVDQLRDILGA
jgi:histidinol-phosphate aminotransferase